LRPSAVYDMNKPVWFLVASSCLAAPYAGPAAEEAVVAYEYAGGWDRCGPAPAEGEEAPVFMRPSRIGVGPDGTVYVTEDSAPSVYYFTPEGAYLGTLPPPRESASGYFGSRGVAAGADGAVYVADHYDLRIVVYDAERSYVTDWRTPPGKTRHFYSSILEDVAVAGGGNIYVSYRSPPPLKLGFGRPVRIDCFTPAGSLVAHWAASGEGIGVGPDGTVYVADYRNNFVDAYDARGRYRGLWGGEGSGPGEFRRPNDVAVGPDGTVFVADAGNYRVQYFTSSGRYLGQWGEKGTKAGQFGWISALTVAPNGTVYVVDRGNGRVQYFKPEVRDG
jgi:tripartite motif-containing protein 71